MARFAGIDVGGSRKGFHVAVLDPSKGFEWVRGIHRVEDILAELKQIDDLQGVAIDCPPKARRPNKRTRLSERQMNKRFKVQWTRWSDKEPAEWMENGENLWKTLREGLPQVQIVETFPTAVSGKLAACPYSIPLSLLEGGPPERAVYKDLIDACLCAWVAEKVAQGEAERVGVDPETGEVDELGPIYF
ncbi:MAG: DUF429 domain-containing protein [Armatimonadetes bacterium]|nr:DUF429 domain-containing protein [Armatimonadota bacterium]